MKTSENKLKLLDLIFDYQSNDWIQIKNKEQLDIASNLWGSEYCGIALSEECLNLFWPDLQPLFYSDYVKKFNVKFEDTNKIYFSFYGVYSNQDLPPMKKLTSFGGSEGFVQFFSNSELFSYCYYRAGSKRVFFKFVHELQQIMDNYKIPRNKYGYI
jgi:hypothetical protein